VICAAAEKEIEMGRPLLTRRSLLVTLGSGTMAAYALGVRSVCAELKFVFIDLQPKGNQKLTDDLHGTEGNSFASLPQGELKLEKQVFKIGEKYVHLQSKHSPDLPEKAEGLNVGAKGDKLLILQTVGWGEGGDKVDDGTLVGTFNVHYADDTSENVVIKYGEDVRDWWDWPDRPNVTKGKLAWTGTNKPATDNQRKIRLFSTEWFNPHKDKEIKSIDLRSENGECDPMLFALTLVTG
jgi:hypothetical protein